MVQTVELAIDRSCRNRDFIGAFGRALLVVRLDVRSKSFPVGRLNICDQVDLFQLGRSLFFAMELLR